MIVESYEDVIILSGALRSNFWDTIHTAISLTLKRHPSGVIIDFSGITEATEEGLDTFVDAMHFINSHDARIIVAAVPEPVMQILRRVPEVKSQLPIAASVAEARRSLDLLTEQEEGKKKKGKAIVAPLGASNIIVCLTGDRCDVEALRLGSQIADSVAAEIHLVYVVIVPRELPLQSPLPKQEELAFAAIDQAKAFLKDQHLAHKPRLERGRDIASAIEDVLEEINANLVIIPLLSAPDQVESSAKLVKSVLAKVTKEVIFVRGCPATR